MDHITSQLNNIRICRQITQIPVFPLNHLVNYPPTGEYFTYTGKMNKVGGDYGISQWIVFTKTCGVNIKQVLQ